MPTASESRGWSSFPPNGPDAQARQRFFVEHGDAVWHVDVYGAILESFVLAKIELKQDTEELALPRWIGREVTGDPHYRKINMVAQRVRAPSISVCACLRALMAAVTAARFSFWHFLARSGVAAIWVLPLLTASEVDDRG